jgi:hypothetical protein
VNIVESSSGPVPTVVRIAGLAAALPVNQSIVRTSHSCTFALVPPGTAEDRFGS